MGSSPAPPPPPPAPSADGADIAASLSITTPKEAKATRGRRKRCSSRGLGGPTGLANPIYFGPSPGPQNFSCCLPSYFSLSSLTSPLLSRTHSTLARVKHLEFRRFFGGENLEKVTNVGRAEHEHTSGDRGAHCKIAEATGAPGGRPRGDSGPQSRGRRRGSVGGQRRSPLLSLALRIASRSDRGCHRPPAIPGSPGAAGLPAPRSELEWTSAPSGAQSSSNPASGRPWGPLSSGWGLGPTSI